MSLTSIVGKLFIPRQKELEKHLTHAEEQQEKVLNYLVSRGRLTEYGHRHGFDAIKNYDDFTRLVPQNSYEELKGAIDRMRHGERDVLWPGQVKWFAKSRAPPTTSRSSSLSLPKVCNASTMPVVRTV